MNSPEITGLLEKADRSLAAAELLYVDGFPDFAVGRAYYAMFYAAEAILLSRGLTFPNIPRLLQLLDNNLLKQASLRPLSIGISLTHLTFATLATTVRSAL